MKAEQIDKTNLIGVKHELKETLTLFNIKVRLHC